MSTAFTTDIYKKIKPKADDFHYLKIARISGVITGSIGILLALLMATWNILSLFDYFNYILGLMTSGLGGLFIMGIFFPRINGKSALLGFGCGIIILLLVNNLTDIHFLFYGFIGIFSTVAIALISSYLFAPLQKDLTNLTYKSLKEDINEQGT